jgi:hypothetical protein
MSTSTPVRALILDGDQANPLETILRASKAVAEGQMTDAEFDLLFDKVAADPEARKVLAAFGQTINRKIEDANG